MKSITKLSLLVLTAFALAALPATAQTDATTATTTNATPRPPRPRVPQVGGTISSIDATAMTMTLKSRAGDVIVKVTSDTRITKDREPAVFADAKEGLRVTVRGKKQDDGSWVATSLSINTKVPRQPPANATPPPSSPDQK
jgi:hypothetical protein